jgi:hypothetical protein
MKTLPWRNTADCTLTGFRQVPRMLVGLLNRSRRSVHGLTSQRTACAAVMVQDAAPRGTRP